MNSFEDFDPNEEDEEAFGETPEIEQPEFEEIFQSETDLSNARRREGNDRISKPFLGKLAKARLIAARSRQIQIGAPLVIPVERLKSRNSQDIAKQELQERVIPIKIIRRFADGTYEVWNIKDFKWIARD